MAQQRQKRFTRQVHPSALQVGQSAFQRDMNIDQDLFIAGVTVRADYQVVKRTPILAVPGLTWPT